MLKDAAKRRALQVLRKAKDALPGGAHPPPLDTSSLPKPASKPLTRLPGHSKATLPSINRLLGRPRQTPPPRKSFNRKDSGAEPRSNEGSGRLHAGLPIIQLNHVKGKKPTGRELGLYDSIQAHLASDLANGGSPSTPEDLLESGGLDSPFKAPAMDMATTLAPAPSSFSTGWVKEDWYSEPWEKGASFCHTYRFETGT